MKIVISSEAVKIYNSGCAPQEIRHQEWLSILSKIQGTTLEVETKYLFKDQYNTPPIKGVSEQGLRIRDNIVTQVIDDERIGRGKCNYCGQHSVKTVKGCEHCENGLEYMEWFDTHINLIQSIRDESIYKKRGYNAAGEKV